LKPLSAFVGMTGEMRELATVVSKVRLDFPFSCKEIFVIFVIWECCFFLFTVADSAYFWMCNLFLLSCDSQQVISLHAAMFLSDTQWEEVTKTVPF